MTKPTAVVFDVNETLLDMSALDPLFADAFSDKAVRRVWFAQAISNMLAATLVGTYADFGEMQRAALEMTAKRRGVAIDPERVRRILRGVLALPAHGDVHAGLGRLRDYFEAVLSADTLRRFKPAAEPYAMAADHLDLAPAQILFAAAHDWDVTGAMKAGYRAAFVARHGTSLNPLEAPPETIVPDIRTLAETIVGTEIPA